MPAAKAQVVTSKIAKRSFRPLSAPIKIAPATKIVAVNIRLARRMYGSLPSEKATLSAPVVATVPAVGLPKATARASGTVKPTAFLRAIQGSILEKSKRVMVSQSAAPELGFSGNSVAVGGGA